jgi:hypothetical protein
LQSASGASRSTQSSQCNNVPHLMRAKRAAIQPTAIDRVYKRTSAEGLREEVIWCNCDRRLFLSVASCGEKYITAESVPHLALLLLRFFGCSYRASLSRCAPHFEQCRCECGSYAQIRLQCDKETISTLPPRRRYVRGLGYCCISALTERGISPIPRPMRKNSPAIYCIVNC